MGGTELGEGVAPVAALRAKLAAPAMSERLAMGGEVADAIQRFLRHPGSTYLRHYLAIQVLMITLLLQACEALRVVATTAQLGVALANRMRTYIAERVADGEDVGVASVARRFSVSYAYAKFIFRMHVDQPIGGYIRTCKLEQARHMLAAGEPPAQVARYVCWTYGHFNKAFKARYGVPPSRYRDPL